MDLARLEIFAQAAALGSLTRVAVRMDATHSAISRQISALEAECGGRLFDRTGRGITLTELGARILPDVRALLQSARALDEQIKGAIGVPAGEVRLGMLAATANMLLPALHRQLQAECPAVRLQVREGSSGQIDEWVASGEVDLGLAARQGTSIPPHEEPLATGDSYLVGAVGDALTHDDTVAFARLSGLPLVLATAPNGMRKSLEQIASRQDVQLRVVMEANSLFAQIAMARSGCAYAILALEAIRDERYRGLLTAARIVDPVIRRTITLTATTQRPLGLAGRVVSRAIRKVAGDLTQSGEWTAVEPG